MNNTQHLTVGLLGGSFNPAHAGHLHLSETAHRLLGIDQVWWLVSPGNPLKEKAETAPFAERLESARAITKHYPHIHISDIEQKFDTCYTIDTLQRLKRRFPHIRFIWLMGADNLYQFHLWKRWQDIFDMMPIAIFDRAPYSHIALQQKAPLRYARWRSPESQSAALKYHSAPAWCFIHMPRHPASSTNIRKSLENG